ncbi:MAG: hypothetical protein WAM70_17075, partial [Pyrinomonadaceae bacterium]
MPNKRIPGSPGTIPPTGTAPENDPTPPLTPSTPITTTRTATSPGRIVSEGGKYFVVWGNNRIPIENPDVLSGITKRVSASNSAVSPDLQNAVGVASQNREALLLKNNVISVRAGYLFQDGKITSIPAVVVGVRTSPGKKFDKQALKNELGLPQTIDGVPVDIEIADPFDQLLSGPETEAVPLLRRRPQLLIDEIQATGVEAELLEAMPIITYEPPPNGDLSPVTGAMTLTCHVSPEAGWIVLQPFLESTERRLHLGMYDFTAPHIYRTARTLLKSSTVDWQQTLGPKESLPKEDDVDSTKANDISETSVVKGLKRVGSDRFGNAFAHIGAGRTFASAYHIKVAVRDERAFWLSSGNWQSSNQPDIDFFDENADRQL